jgi:hypothetical protein
MAAAVSGRNVDVLAQQRDAGLVSILLQKSLFEEETIASNAELVR